MLILGIESSCDETATAVVRDGREILSSEIYSQIELHKRFGGVVPELASREHLSRIQRLVDAALVKAKVSIADIDAVAVTQGPGLVGALLVGVSYAKSLAFGLGVPCIGVNHIEGHVYSVVFDNPAVQYPALALIVSGGHTNLFLVPEEGLYKVMSRTRDDAAGEAFDKVAKMLGLGYPGGPAIEMAAQKGDPKAIKFTRAKISDGRPDFSFSGLKTAVAKHLNENDLSSVSGEIRNAALCDIAASFQATVIDSLIGTVRRVAAETKPKTLIVAGGVACNLVLRREAANLGSALGIPVYFPTKHLSTDNAAMIAAAAYPHFMGGEVSDLTMTADVTLRLQNFENEDPELKEKGVSYRM